MGVRVIQRGAAVTRAHLEGRRSQGHGGRRRGRLPWLAGALINAAERTFLLATNFLLSEGIYTGFRCSRRRLKSRVARFQGGLRILFCLVCPRAEKRQSHSSV